MHCIAWLGGIVAWATDSGVRVYNSATHALVGKVARPPAAGTGHCSLQLVSGDLVLVGWPYHIQVIRCVTPVYR